MEFAASKLSAAQVSYRMQAMRLNSAGEHWLASIACHAAKNQRAILFCNSILGVIKTSISLFFVVNVRLLNR